MGFAFLSISNGVYSGLYVTICKAFSQYFQVKVVQYLLLTFPAMGEIRRYFD